MYGAMEVQGVMWVWDYVKEEPVKKSDQTHEEWQASERRKYELMRAQTGDTGHLSLQNEEPF